MLCPTCNRTQPRNAWTCPDCGAPLEGGVVFVTGVSGTGSDSVISSVVECAQSAGHEHAVSIHDVGHLMHQHAKFQEPTVAWEKILDASPRVLRFLRALALQEISYEIKANPKHLHIIDLHLSFRWKPYLTPGFEPYILREFIPFVRLFINLIEDLPRIQERLKETSWGNRKILELLIWRDEELHLTDMFADFCGRVESFAVATGEPPETIERIIWHPEFKKVYLSFPITGILNDVEARSEIELFRDHVREFVIAFDPYACRDYDETYRRQEMTGLRTEVGETTRDRDFRFIDQADAVVVYYPRTVASKGVDAEMNHARDTGKPIYLYSPEELGGGPFAVPADHYRNDPTAYLELLKSRLAPPAK